MREGRHLRISLAIAGLAHVGAIVALRVAPVPAPLTPPREIAGAALFEVERDESPAPEERAASSSATAGTAPGDVVARRDRARRDGAEAATPTDGDATAVTSDASPLVVTAPDGDGWSFRASTVDIGIDPRKRALLAAGATGATRSASGGDAPPTSATGGLAEGLDALDVERGLGRGGVVSTAIHEAVQGSSVMGTAIFAVTIDASGTVTVGVSSASRDEAGWARLNEVIRANVLARKDQIRVPAGVHGLRIAVQAEAKEQFPNGVKPNELGTRGVAKGPSVTETKDHIDIQLPEIALKHHGKVCDVAVSPIPPFISGGCDPSNVGAVAQRIVTARVVSESRL